MKKKHKERKRGNKTGIRSIHDVTISQCVVIRIGKKKRQKLIRLLHVILHRKLRFHGVESGNRNVVGHFIFSFFVSFFFFKTFSIRSVMNSQGSRVFYDFFFISFFFFRSISNCLFVGSFYVAGNEFVLKGLPDVHIYIYIYSIDPYMRCTRESMMAMMTQCF